MSPGVKQAASLPMEASLPGSVEQQQHDGRPNGGGGGGAAKPASKPQLKHSASRLRREHAAAA